MKRLLITSMLLFLLLPATAQAVPLVIGGSAEQRQAVREVIASCFVSTDRLKVVLICDDLSEYRFRVAAVSLPGHILMKASYDNLRPGNQRVRYDWGEDCPIFRDILCHEYGHQVWDSLPEEKHELWNKLHFRLEGWPPAYEAFAENFRLTMFPPEMRWRDTTVSPYPMLPADVFMEFLGQLSFIEEPFLYQYRSPLESIYR